MTFFRSLICHPGTALLIWAGASFGSIQASAGTPAQVDLSLGVVVSPKTFVPGGRNTIALTVHNGGPDVAGGNTSSSIDVYGEGYIITTQPPPYEVVEPIEGCWVERFVTEPLPDNNIGLLFVYYFDSIPAGQSRTCTYDIEFYPSTSAPLTLEWQVENWYTDIDTDSSNNTVDYTLVAAPALSPSEPVPALSPLGWLTLGLGLLLTGCLMRGRASP